MAARLADRLSKARHNLFVGRDAEQALFRTALEAKDLPFHVLYIAGLGGVGKSTLLREFTILCQERKVEAINIDGRNLEPSPGPFLNAVGASLGLAPDASPVEFLAQQSGRYVLLLDTYELLAPLDSWLREEFLPQLPDNIMMVLAGRQPPALGWRGDPGWQELVRILPLRNLSPEESRAYLERREVPPKQHRAVLDFTHGHPLALSLVADLFSQRTSGDKSNGSQSSDYTALFQPGAAPDVVKVLLEHLVQHVPSERHRHALEACALVRLTTEEILSEMLDEPNVHDLFEWLRSLSFVELGRPGLFPHDLAREALIADLRWRNPDYYAELHRHARNYYATRLQHTQEVEQERILFDYIFLHRDNPVVRPFLEWQESGVFTHGVARADELPALIAMVTQQEGRASARLAKHWFDLQPHNVIVLRDNENTIAGFVNMLELHKANGDDLRTDPATSVAWRYLQQHAPLRPGEGATYFRFWMARDTYQAVSSAQSLIFVTIVRHYLTTPGLAYTFFACAEASFWTPIMGYADALHLTELDFEVGGRTYGVFAHDWRAVPPMAWLALMAEREIETTAHTATPPATTPAVVVLSQPEFVAAVHQALRGMTRPGTLRNNPLLRSRLVVERTGVNASDPERIASLQALITEVCETLQASPRDSKFYRALYHTYLHPAPTQEEAADLMDVPFSTFRRHLKSGIAQVTDLLWQREVGS